MTSSVKILVLDLETAPATLYTWGLYNQNMSINQVAFDEYLLCWCAKWIDSKEIISDALINYKDFHRNPRNDLNIAKTLHKIVDEADIIVTHNGVDFDLKWLNTLFIKHNLKPVSAYKAVDTKIEAKKRFRFLSNKLDFICQKLGMGRKLHTGGFELWTKCMQGEKRAWQNMVKYCKQDILLLEKLYLKMRPYMKSHPNLSLYYDRKKTVCSNCGSKNLESRGYLLTTTCKYNRYQCKDCGKWMRGNTKIAYDKVKTIGI